MKPSYLDPKKEKKNKKKTNKHVYWLLITQAIYYFSP